MHAHQSMTVHRNRDISLRTYILLMSPADTDGQSVLLQFRVPAQTSAIITNGEQALHACICTSLNHHA